jgi:starch synthase
MVSRLTHQKGIDLVLAAAEALAGIPVQLAVIGTGDRELVEKLRATHARLRESMGVFIGFDESLAHLLEAGSDGFLMPSRFEPCGMNQMYSQRYGTPPIANATGGLIDTITDVELTTGDKPATGFLMMEPTVPSLVATVQRAVAMWRDARAWRTLQLNGMSRDFGWSNAAKQYQGIYESLRPTS